MSNVQIDHEADLRLSFTRNRCVMTCNLVRKRILILHARVRRCKLGLYLRQMASSMASGSTSEGTCILADALRIGIRSHIVDIDPY